MSTMQTLITVNILEQPQYLASFSPKWSFCIPPLNFENITTQHPNRHYLLLRNNREIVGRCSLWWEKTPSLLNYQVGLIGHYAVTDAEAAAELLDAACSQLHTAGCNFAIAPMDGSTWNNYRLLIERGEHPVFFLEPDHPDVWIEYFRDRNFQTLANYTSALNANLAQSDRRLDKVNQRLEQIGVSIRCVDLHQLETELHHIYHIAIQSFRHNFLFTPITKSQFVAQYSYLSPYIQPELILIAEHQHHPIGFIFAIPDLLQKKRGENINTIIIKTVATQRDRIYAGLGNLLVEKCQTIAHQLGYSQVIHALMHEDNPSVNLSKHYAQQIRRYSLLGKEL